MKSSLNGEKSSRKFKIYIRENLYTGSFYDVAQPYKLLKSQQIGYDDFLFLS